MYQARSQDAAEIGKDGYDQDVFDARQASLDETIFEEDQAEKDREELVENVSRLAKAFLKRHEMSHEKDSERDVSLDLTTSVVS